MKRRTFIVITSAGAAFAGLASCSFFRWEIKDEILAEPIHLHFILDEAMLSSLGNKYAMKFPNDNYKDQLDRLITKNRSDPAAIKLELERIIHQDFKGEQTVILDGWVLSRTEARQCALFNHLNT